MQFTLTLAALAATASASFAIRDADVSANFGNAKVVNRCPYDVYLWSINKQLGCPPGESTLLKKNGGQWQEKMKIGTNGGISVKLSKTNACTKEITQLEYKHETNKPGYNGNYLDMSFVDCLGKQDCPGFHDGFYMQSGKGNNPKSDVSVNSAICPVLKSSNAVEAAKVSYINPDDERTKFCQSDADLVLYLCGNQAPGANDNSPSSSAPSSSKPVAPSQPQPTTLQVVPTKPVDKSDDVKVKAAEVTPAPQPPAPQAPKAVKTVVVYKTVDAPMHKRHAHGRRHSHRA